MYRDKPSASLRTVDSEEGYWHGSFNYWGSIGIRVGDDGKIADVSWNGPADKARVIPGDKIIAVNNVIYSDDVLHEAIRKANGSSDPIHLIVQSDKYIRTADINYHDGERYPALERVDGATDYLDEITKPLTTPEKAPETPKETE